MDENDFVNMHEREIIESLNAQQNIYTITSKNNLKSKNKVYFGYRRTYRSQEINERNNTPQNNENLELVKTFFALKLLKYYTKKQIKNFDREKNVLDLFIDDQRIIKYIEVIPVYLYTKKHILVSMYFYQNVDLLFYLWRPSFSFDEHFICIIAFKALKILDLLKSRGVVHNDIKFENFIVSSEYPFEFILTDFESSEMVNDEGQSLLIGGTPIFKSPEVLRGEPHNYETDIWSLGVNLFYHLCNEYPFGILENENNNNSEEQILEKIQNNEIVRKDKYNVSIDAWELLTLMLVKDPNQRITVENALKLNWFQFIQDREVKSMPSRINFDPTFDNEVESPST